MAYFLAVFCFVLLLFAVFICMYVFLFLFFATTSLVNKDLYNKRKRCVAVNSGLVVNGLRILDLASANDRRVTIRGDVELNIASQRTDEDDEDDEW